MFEWRTSVSIKKLLGREIEVSQIVKRCFLKKKGKGRDVLVFICEILQERGRGGFGELGVFGDYVEGCRELM